MLRTNENSKVMLIKRVFLGQPVDVDSECRRDGPKLPPSECLEPITALYRDLLVS